MPDVKVDNSGEIYGFDVSIADLAAFSFDDFDSDKINIYGAEAIALEDWAWEIASIEKEYLVGIDIAFKDGSKLSVAARDVDRSGEISGADPA